MRRDTGQPPARRSKWHRSQNSSTRGSKGYVVQNYATNDENEDEKEEEGPDDDEDDSPHDVYGEDDDEGWSEAEETHGDPEIDEDEEDDEDEDGDTVKMEGSE